MDALKWLGALFLAICGVSVIVGGAILSAIIGVVVGALSLLATAVVFLAIYIKERYSKRKPRT